MGHPERDMQSNPTPTIRPTGEAGHPERNMQSIYVLQKSSINPKTKQNTEPSTVEMVSQNSLARYKGDQNSRTSICKMLPEIYKN